MNKRKINRTVNWILDLVLAIKDPNLDKLAKLCSLRLVALHLWTVKG